MASEKKHTQEPWDNNTAVRIEAGDNRVRLSNRPAPVPVRILVEGNYQRAVACVNACADINPAAVPVMVEALVLIRDHPAATDTIRERCLAALQLAGVTP